MYKTVTRGNYRGPKGQSFTMPSLTIPDQTLSLQDLLSRYVRGQEVPSLSGVFVDDDYVPVDLERMTPQDRIDMSRAVARDIAEKQKILGSRASKKDVPTQASFSPVEDVEGV